MPASVATTMRPVGQCPGTGSSSLDRLAAMNESRCGGSRHRMEKLNCASIR
jgi:hypothetical protein